MIEVFGGRRHLDFVKRLRKFDIYVDDSGYAFTAIAGFLAKIPLRIGRNFQGFGFLDHFEVPLDRNSQLIERRLKLLKVFGVKLSLNDVPKPYFKVDAHVRDAILRQHGLSHLKYFTIQPFAGWDAKNWGIDKYCMVSKLFASYSGMTPVFLGADYEDTLIDDAIRKQGMTAVNIAGAGGLKDTAAIIAAARMHFGADSVGSQLAISIGIKSLTIFGPVNPMLCSYLGGHNIGVIKRTRCMAKPGKLYCCFDAGRSCSRASCMKELSEDDVLRVLIDVWTGKERRPVVEL
jgi:ADP-heptose:LPS heptosyltransferase